MTAPKPLPDGEMFVANGPLLLCERLVEAQPIASYQFAGAGEQLMVKCRFAGRWNHSTEGGDVEVLMEPDQALALVDQVLVSLNTLAGRARTRGGRPR